MFYLKRRRVTRTTGFFLTVCSFFPLDCFVPSGIRRVSLHSRGQQDHLRQGGPAGWHHQLSEAQRPQRPAQRLVTQTQLSHVSGQQDHASHRQGGDDPQPAVKRQRCSALFLSFFWLIFVFFFPQCGNVSEYTV